MDDKLYKKIKRIIHPENIISSVDELEKYSRDESPVLFAKPELAVTPSAKEELTELISFANSERIAITPRGGGTGLSGGAVPFNGGIVISTEKLNSVVDIDTVNHTAVVEPGVINSVLQSESESLGLFYPINPASMDSCTLGGNLAEATGGANTLKYGTTRNFVTGLQAVNPDGRTWSAGGRILKNSTDSQLIHLMCGSEGTLSFFTSITVRLVKKPVFSAWIIAAFAKQADIFRAARKILDSRLEPTMLELMDKNTISLCEDYLATSIQFSAYDQILIRLDSDEKEDLEKRSIFAGEICSSLRSEEVLIADSHASQERIWKIRTSMHDSIISTGLSVCEEDTVVPRTSIESFVEKVYSIEDDYPVRASIFGHLGDGNLHINILKQYAAAHLNSDDIENIRNYIFSEALKAGGKLSGEHGIGITKKGFFKNMIDPVYLDMLKRIKKELDPNNILNPGKILDI